MPSLCHLSQQSPLTFIAPPYLPYAPAFQQAGVELAQLTIIDNDITAEDIWWSAEKILRHPQCGAVLVWPKQFNANRIRRLQLAASSANNFGVLFRCGSPLETPVPLRLKLSRAPDGLLIQLLKSRFNWQQNTSVTLSL